MSRRIWLSEIRYSSTCLALIAAAFFKSGLSAEVCGDERYSGPISIPITDVLLKQGMSSFGALVRIGTTDVRNFSMELNTNVNETFVWDSGGPNPGECGDTTRAQCERMRGGLYERDPANGWKESPRLDFVDSTTYRGTDTISLGTSQLTEAPLTVISKVAMNGLGLGPSSSLLDRLINDSLIASRSWSAWGGQFASGAKEAMDGHIVFGGQDEAKITGDNETFPTLPVESDCDTGLVIEVTDISMINPDGRATGLLRTPFNNKFCLAPGMPILFLPRDVFQIMSDEIGEEPEEDMGIDQTRGAVGPVYQAEKAWKGDLLFTLSGGLQIVISNDQISTPARRVSDQGILTYDDTMRELRVQPIGADIPDSSRLGIIFLTAAVLTVNRDARTHTLHVSRNTTESRLAPIVADGDTCSFPRTQAPFPTTSPATEPIGASTDMGPRAIVGAVIGAVVGLAFVAAIAVLIVRRRGRAAYSSVTARERIGTGRAETENREATAELSATFARELRGTPVAELPDNNTRRRI